VVSACSQLRFGTAALRCAGSKAFRLYDVDRAQPLGAALTVRLSKIVDYLIDNLCLSILSRVEAWGQGKSGPAADPIPFGNVSPAPFAIGAGQPYCWLGNSGHASHASAVIDRAMEYL